MSIGSDIRRGVYHSSRPEPWHVATAGLASAVTRRTRPGLRKTYSGASMDLARPESLSNTQRALVVDYNEGVSPSLVSNWYDITPALPTASRASRSFLSKDPEGGPLRDFLFEGPFRAFLSNAPYWLFRLCRNDITDRTSDRWIESYVLSTRKDQHANSRLAALRSAARLFFLTE